MNVNLKNAEEVINTLFDALKDAQREQNKYKNLYDLALNDIVNLRDELEKAKQSKKEGEVCLGG